MKLFTRSVGATAALAAAVAGTLAFGSGAASAATAPPWEPTAQAVGTLTFYDTAGNVITSGSSLATPFAGYVVGSVKPRAGDNQSGLIYANPDHTSTPVNWFTELAGLFTPNPITTGPANIIAASATQPVYKPSSGDQTLDGFEQDSNRDSDPAYNNIINVRLVTALGANIGPTYDDADLLIDPVAHTWTQIYPAPAPTKTNTTTTVTSSNNSPTTGQNVTLTAQETPAVAGSVQFKDGTTNLGAAVAVDATGKATTSTSFSTAGAHNLSAVFTPTDTTNYNGSTGTTTVTAQAPATATSTALAVTQGQYAGDPASLSATVTSGGTAFSAGSVQFFDGTTSLGTVASGPNGVYTLSLPAGFAAGSHSVSAVFTPTSATYNSSTSAAQTFFTQSRPVGACAVTGSVCSDPQGIRVTIPVGTLVINTPYTAQAPLDLGFAALDPTGSYFTASAPFQNIKVTDGRSGTNGVNQYTVSALSSPLTDGGTNPGSTINSQNVGLTNLTSTPGPGFTGTVVTTDNPAATPPVAPATAGNLGLGGTTPHTVFTATNSLGQVAVNGTLTVNAPVSTESGTFNGVVTFTVA